MCLVEKAVDVGAMKNALIITTKDKVLSYERFFK